MTEKKKVSKPDNKVEDLEPTKDTKGGGPKPASGVGVGGIKVPVQPNPTT